MPTRRSAICSPRSVLDGQFGARACASAAIPSATGLWWSSPEGRDALTPVTNIFLLLPGLPLLIILDAFLLPGTSTVILVLVVTGWAGSARVLCAQAESIRGKDFAAAVVTGERPLRIMFRTLKEGGVTPGVEKGAASPL
ncbi:hypothetical protein ACU639_35770 [Streptomyces cynarae]|uniref:hypothetical protein n=1 Tax=Streptomyces cynarae TaxID=2981134 RepID=UPI00406CAC71